MATRIDELLKKLDVNLYDQLDKYTGEGKKVIGICPPYAPEELIYAAGMIPMTVWGEEGEVTDAKAYFPAFYTSIILRTLDLGLQGKLDKMSGMVVGALSDTLKGMSQNWKKGVKNVPMLYIGYGQNRKIKAGLDYNEIQYLRLKQQLEFISGEGIKERDIETAIVLYNKHRKAMKKFNDLAAKHLNTITPSIRSRVISAGDVMDKAEHLEIVEALNEELEVMPEEEFDGKKVVTTGLLADSKDLLEILEKHKIAIVDDNVCQESGQYDYLVDEESGNPIRALAKWISDIEGCPVLYDPKKLRGSIIIDKVNKQGADGVLYLMTKFSDSDEFDYPIIKKQLEEAGITHTYIEIDQQMNNFEQANTALQTFADIL